MAGFELQPKILGEGAGDMIKQCSNWGRQNKMEHIIILLIDESSNKCMQWCDNLTSLPTNGVTHYFCAVLRGCQKWLLMEPSRAIPKYLINFLQSMETEINSMCLLPNKNSSSYEYIWCESFKIISNP